MKARLFITSFGLLMVGAMTASAHHVDVRGYVSQGQIVTGSAELVGAVVVPLSDNQRVFGAEFGEDDPSQPFFTEDPGFLSEDGAFPGGAGHFVGFNVLAGLKYWDGSTFVAVPNLESLQIVKGSQDVTVGSGPVTGFNFAVIDADGGLHEHLEFFLLGADGDPDPNNGFAPTAGVYLLELELTTTLPGVQPSLPFWIVFNNGADEDEHHAAMEYVATVLVPEPATLVLLGLGARLIRRRRRR